MRFCGSFSSLCSPSSLLLIEYVAATALEHDVDNAMLRKDKQSLPMPVSLHVTSWHTLVFMAVGGIVLLLEV